MAKEIVIDSDKKTVKKKLVVFIVFLIIAAVCLTYAVVSCTQGIKVDEGLKQIELNSIKLPNKETVMPFDDEIDLYYYVNKDKKRSTNENLTRTTRAFNAISGRAYKMFNSQYEFNDYIGLAYINNHPNQPIKVSDELYKALKDAYQKTIKTDSHYNVFAGKINDFWQLMVSSKNHNVDPLYNENNQEYLDQVVRATTYDGKKFDLQFNDTMKTITFALDTNNNQLYYQGNCLIKLDFNILLEAYAMDTISTYLITNGFTKGYLISKSGLYMHLQEYWTKEQFVTISTNIFAKDEGETNLSTKKLAKFTTDGAVRFATFMDYYVSETDTSKYQIAKENETKRRHLVYDCKTGYPTNNMRYSRLLINDNHITLSDLCYQNLQLVCTASERIDEYITSSLNDYGVIYIQSNVYDDVIDSNFKLIYHNIPTIEITEKYQSYCQELS